MIELNTDRTVVVDCDDTLVHWNISKYLDYYKQFIIFEHEGYHVTLFPNKKNINLVRKFKKLGYSVIVWSQSGKDWAKKVVEELELVSYVDIVGTKPNYYIDDLPVNTWMTSRVWRDPITGKESKNAYDSSDSRDTD